MKHLWFVICDVCMFDFRVIFVSGILSNTWCVLQVNLERVVGRGDAKNVICRTVEKLGADTLVMGCHGYGFFQRSVHKFISSSSFSNNFHNFSRCSFSFQTKQTDKTNNCYKNRSDLKIHGCTIPLNCPITNKFLSVTKICHITNYDWTNVVCT